MKDLTIIGVMEGEANKITFSKDDSEQPFVCGIFDQDVGILLGRFDEIDADRLYAWLGRALGKEG